ncbi:MAG: RNA 2',3'-cyclic phosphodiesterase [Candidatus Omnitrophica bacterium]|nr:RNA 2',3'-cyclic phosphodiesterase [Candidatus Omnitrophota bacterium]MBU4487607.1 RNA 2',3'-cyclic phosphodiesterase [Candidatus Omnitrophota bacterium]MCG2705690.1 RNA 2',3'-cyclic phosphodiesterase [Candidatus Omnitrophota bacterium]
MSETIRSFIAIELSPEIKAALQQIEDELKPKIFGVKWVKPDNIHLTLKFLGHIDTHAVESVRTVLAAITQSAKPFILGLSSLGAFPTLERPRVIWIGINKGSGESTALANAIDDKVSEFGIEKEGRAFHPHLTLGRIDFLKDKNALKNAFASLKVPPLAMAASKITLFQSILVREGAIYTILHEVALR